MQLKQPLLAASLLFSAASFNAHALTTAYTGAGNVGLVYSSVTGLTWTQDGNLFKTLYDSDNNLINQIVAITPSYDDPYYGLQTIDPVDFYTSTGRMSWWGSLAFVNYLNSIDYGGSDQWRLPMVIDTGTAGCNFAYSGSDCGYNVDTNTGELAALYYDELSAKAYYNTNGSRLLSGYNILGTSTTTDTTGSVGAFDNVHTAPYWSGTEYAQSPNNTWIFYNNAGLQNNSNKNGRFYAWPVAPDKWPPCRNQPPPGYLGRRR